MKKLVIATLLSLACFPSFAQNDTFHLIQGFQLLAGERSKESKGMKCSYQYDFSKVVKRWGKDSLFDQQVFVVHVRFVRNDSLIAVSKGYREHADSKGKFDYTISLSGLSLSSFPSGSKSWYVPYASLAIPEGESMIAGSISVENKKYGILQKAERSKATVVKKEAVLKVSLKMEDLIIASNGWDLGLFTGGKADPHLELGIGGLNIYSKSVNNSHVLFSANQAIQQFEICSGDAFTIKIFDEDPDTDDFIGKISFPHTIADRTKKFVYDMPFDWLEKVRITYEIN